MIVGAGILLVVIVLILVDVGQTSRRPDEGPPVARE